MADPIPCRYCTDTFKTQTEWKEHVATEHDIAGYPCDLCSEVFYKEQDYLQHFDSQHKSDFGRHVCSHCGVSYKWFKFLQQHIKKKHNIETMKSCERCGEEFYNSLAYRQHLKLKHAPGKKFHKCRKCHRSFTAKTFLQMHDKFDHSKRGPKRFKEYVLENLNLDKESLLESSKKCLECNLKFSSSIYLFKHFKLTHNKKKYYLCCQCKEAVYHTRAGLSIHLHYEHGVDREHKCSKCTYGHRTPPKTDKKEKEKKSVAKEVPSESVTPPWASEFKSNDVPEDLELINASEVEINNLRSNIKSLFHLLATVPPSKLKASAQKTPAPFTETFFSMKNATKANVIGKDGRRNHGLKPKNVQLSKNSEVHNVTDDSISAASQKESTVVEKDVVKGKTNNAAEKGARNVKQKVKKNKVHFQCHKCKDRFALRKALQDHLLKRHGFKGFPIVKSNASGEKEGAALSEMCKEIEESFTKNETLTQMANEQAPEDTRTKYKCNFCNIEFDEQLLLLNHLTEKHGNTEEKTELKVIFKCPYCYVAYDTDSALAAHMKTHTKQDENGKKVCKVCKKHLQKTKTVYKCLKCERKFAKRTILHRHIQRQHKPPIYRCEKCTSSFKMEDKLKQHMQIKHSTVQTTNLPVIKIQKSKLSPIKLDKLPNILSNILSKNLLNGTLHNCKICNSYFPSNELLQRHIQWEHTKNVNLHKCGQCNQVLYSVEDLELHMSTTHNNDGPFKWKKQIAFNYEHQTDI